MIFCDCSASERPKRPKIARKFDWSAKRLSTYGLGVFVPHMHTETGEFVRLPPDMVQIEDDLKVSFELRSEVSGGAVGWVWNNETMVAEVCRV